MVTVGLQAQAKSGTEPVHILMISHDSTSVSEYKRIMPKSRSKLETLDAAFFEGHGIVGVSHS